MMSEQDNKNEGPPPERVAVLQNLPKEIVAQLSKEEINAFLFKDEWPNSLREKLKDFLE